MCRFFDNYRKEELALWMNLCLNQIKKLIWERYQIMILRKVNQFLLLEKNNRIKVRTTEADKIPGLDGRISILDKNKHDRIIV